MCPVHLVFGDIDNNAGYPFIKRVKLIETFREICLSNKPKLNSHSFFDVDNDSIMIGLSGLEDFLSGNDVLKYVQNLYWKLKKNNINVSFGVNLIACQSEIDRSTCPGILDDIRRIYMPDTEFNATGSVLRPILVGNPLIVVAQILEIAKETKNPICFALANGKHPNNYFDREMIIRPIIGWHKMISHEHASLLKENGIQDVYCLDVTSK